MMSRPVAGVRNTNSPKGAKENLQAVLKLLPHACLQAAGEDSRSSHIGGVKELEKDAGVSTKGIGAAAVAGHSHSYGHSHHHHDHGHGGHKVPKAHTSPSERPLQSNDPKVGATFRVRSSPYPMLSVAQAVENILQHTP